MNMASVDSEMIGNTSLANVPRKFYPTLLLVGKDKKPATFMDEDGTPTNAMPRSKTLSEDREALSALIQNPTLNSSNISPRNTPYPETLTPQTPETSPLVPEAVSFTKSPYHKTESPVSSVTTPVISPILSQSATSVPPDIGADLVASQSKSTTASAGVIGNPIKGGRLLRAIRNKTASLKAMLRCRKHSKKTHRR